MIICLLKATTENFKLIKDINFMYKLKVSVNWKL